MKKVDIDWNISGGCTAVCPGCHFGQKQMPARSLSDQILHTWGLFQSALSKTGIQIIHEIIPPFYSLGEVDFSFLRTGHAVSTLSFAASLQTPADIGLLLRNFLSQAGYEKGDQLPKIRFIVPPVTPHIFSPGRDMQQFVDQVSFFSQLQKENDLPHVVVGWGQNQVSNESYDLQYSCFSHLLRLLSDPAKTVSLLSESITKKVSAFLQDMEAHHMIYAPERYKSEEVWRDGYSMPLYNGDIGWKHASLGSKFSLSIAVQGDEGEFSSQEQLQQALTASENIDRLSIMFTPSFVYLHHSPETIKSPFVLVPYPVFDRMVEEAAQNPDFHLGMKQQVQSHFRSFL